MMRLPYDNPWNANVVTLSSVNKNEEKWNRIFLSFDFLSSENPLSMNGRGVGEGKETERGEGEAREEWI